MNKFLLNGEWNVCGVNPFTSQQIEFKGVVPGSTINDIFKSGVEKDDIFYRDNMEKYQKYERYNFTYTKKFEFTKTKGTQTLVFEKLDTYCDIYVNDKYLGHCDNGHIKHEFDVTDVVTDGQNEVKVIFYSPITMVDGKPKLRGAFTTERMYTRRTQCSYGWDWLGRIISSGMNSDVYIEMYDPNEPVIDSVYVYTKSIDEFGAYIGISVELGKNSNNRVYDFEIYDDQGNLVKHHSKYLGYQNYIFNTSIEDAKLWYPSGYGKQPLYQLKVLCEGNLLYSQDFGIRTVKIMQNTDKEGSYGYNKCLELKKSDFSKEYDNNTEFSGFILVVNGVKIQCRGANWVPCEPFENGQTKPKTSKILKNAKDMGLNMIRVWGGGTFETKEFYAECSKLGIMVTQDFLMACGSYPEKQDWFIKHLQKEAEYAAKLIRNEPCLMWWSGDNENAVLGNDVMADHPGRSSAMYGIGPVLMRLDPERDFLPSSPYGGSFFASNTVGTTHITQYLSYIFDAIDDLDLSDYKDRYKKLCARFIAEEPTFGLVSTSSLKKFLADEDIFGDSVDMMRYHTKSNPAMRKDIFDYFITLTEKILGNFKDAKDRNFKLRYIQHECVRVSLEQLRRETWFCSGVIFWMLSDCWPAAGGWTFLDYYVMPKASYYSFKRCSKPVVCSIDKNQNTYSVYVCNNNLSDVNANTNIFVIDAVTGEKQLVKTVSSNIKGQWSDVIYTFDYEGDAIVIAENEYDRAFYKNGALNISKKDIEYKIEQNKIILTSTEYIQAVEIEGDIIPTDNWFGMLPGETKVIEFEKIDANEPISVTAYGIEV